MSTRKTFGDMEPSRYPGQRLGIPEQGRGSVARVGRRIAALWIDYALAGIAALLIAPYSSNEWNIATLAFFALTQWVFISTLGGSLGHRALGLRVLSIDGNWIGWRRPLIRTVLLLLVIPALVWDSDQRGFHDTVAGTVLIRSR